MLKVGDRVKYYEYQQVAGDRRFLREDTVTRIESGEYPVTVQHGGSLFQFTKLKKIHDGYTTPPTESGTASSADSDTDDENPHSLKYRTVSAYTLVPGGDGRSSSGVMANAASLTAHGKDLATRSLQSFGPGAICDVFNYSSK